MKQIVISWLAGILLLTAGVADAAPWMTDLPKAQARAKTEKKMVLLDFTGSDWCGWCIKFKADVLATPEFIQYADKNLVLVELDFPGKKAQPADEKKANQALKAKYDVEGFPTLILLDADGKEIGRQRGYSKGGPKAFIAKLEKMRASGR
jgi:thioredoxin-related protein